MLDLGSLFSKGFGGSSSQVAGPQRLGFLLAMKSFGGGVQQEKLILEMTSWRQQAPGVFRVV